MGLAHVTRPVFGVQYHPESVATQHGKRLLANFRDITLALRPASPSPPLVDYGEALALLLAELHLLGSCACRVVCFAGNPPSAVCCHAPGVS